MNLLLDTHAFLWWIDGDPLPAPALRAISDAEHTVWLIVASAWEMTIKASLGKLRLPDHAARYVEQHRQLNGFGYLPIESAALDWLETLPFHHRDPFDRLLMPRRSPAVLLWSVPTRRLMPIPSKDSGHNSHG